VALVVGGSVLAGCTGGERADPPAGDPGVPAVAGDPLPNGRAGDADPPRAVDPTVVTVFAAASLTDVVEALAKELRATRGIEVRASFAASSVLAQQIIHGADVDLFASADPRWADRLVEEDLVASDRVRTFASNRLVLIAPRDDPRTLSIDPEVDPRPAFEGRLAMGDPTHVPVGTHAREALTHLGWWTLLEDRLLPASDARAALAMVATGAVELGIVYATDAAASDRVMVAGVFPSGTHAPIRYVVAPLRDAHPASDEVLSFLSSLAAVRILVQHGFVVLDD
jgi:molybdate transport system substrate-binding protein